MSESGTVLVRRSALGDVVLLGAITASLPRPVTVVTDAPYVELVRRLRGVDQALPWEDRSKARGRVVDLQASWATRRAFPGARRIHKRSVRRRAWLWWGFGAGRPAVPVLYGEAAGVQALRAPWIDTPPSRRDTLLLVPGAAHGPKRAPARLLVAAGRAWEGPVQVLGGPGEEGVVATVADEVPGAATLVERGFARTVEALGRGAAMVVGDTGLMHLAGACGCPVVAVFGPTHPADGFGVHEGAIVQRDDLACRPCTLHRIARCPLGDLACMELDEQRVISALRRVTGVSCAGSS